MARDISSTKSDTVATQGSGSSRKQEKSSNPPEEKPLLTPEAATWRVTTDNYDPNAPRLLFGNTHPSGNARIWTRSVSTTILTIWRQQANPSAKPIEKQASPPKQESPTREKRKPKGPAMWKVVRS